MPISSDRGGVNAAPAATIGADNAPPAVTDFLTAFRQGFITVDDLTRRGASLPAEVEGQRQNLLDTVQLRPLQRQQAAGALSTDIELQPKRATNLAAAEDLKGRLMTEQGRQLPTPSEIQADEATRLKKSQFANALASDVPGVREKALANASQEDVLDAWTVATGQEPPENIQLPGGGVEPKPIEEWVVENYGQDSLAVDAQAVINRPDVQQGYAAYVQEATNRPMTFFKGSPEYLQKLKADIAAADLKAGLQKGAIAAVPAILKAEAEAAAARPAAAAKATSEATENVLRELHRSESLKRFEPQFEAFRKVDELRNSGRAPKNSDDIAIMYEFVKLLDPTSAVREGEAKLAQSTVPAVRAIYNRGRALFTDSNRLFDTQTRQSMYDTIDSLKQGALKSVAPEIGRIAGLAAENGVPLDKVFSKDYQSILTGNTGGNAPSGAPSGLVVGAVVTLRDGRRVRVKAITPTGIIPE